MTLDTQRTFLRSLLILHRSSHISDAIPIIYVPLLMITHVAAFTLLLRPAGSGVTGAAVSRGGLHE